MQVTGRNLSREATASGAGYHQLFPKGSISYKIGEPISETIFGLDAILTQGFQQGTIFSVGIDSELISSVIDLYPNPTIDQFYIVSSYNDPLNVTVLAQTGRFIQELKLVRNTSIDLSKEVAGTYCVRITDKAQYIAATAKLVKLN